MRLYNVIRKSNRVLFQEVSTNTAMELMDRSSTLEMTSVPSIMPKIMDPVITWLSLYNRHGIQKAAWRSADGNFYLSLRTNKGSLADWDYAIQDIKNSQLK